MREPIITLAVFPLIWLTLVAYMIATDAPVGLVIAIVAIIGGGSIRLAYMRGVEAGLRLGLKWLDEKAGHDA